MIPIFMLALAAGCTDSGGNHNDNRPADVRASTLTPDTDGLIRATVSLGSVQELQTIGVQVRIAGADIVEWQRDARFLTSAGGRELLLTTRVEGDSLLLVAGTTTPVSYTDAHPLVSLVLKPTSEAPSLEIITSGDSLGLLGTDGKHQEQGRFSVSSGNNQAGEGA